MSYVRCLFAQSYEDPLTLVTTSLLLLAYKGQNLMQLQKTCYEVLQSQATLRNTATNISLPVTHGFNTRDSMYHWSQEMLTDSNLHHK